MKRYGEHVRIKLVVLASCLAAALIALGAIEARDNFYAADLDVKPRATGTRATSTRPSQSASLTRDQNAGDRDKQIDVNTLNADVRAAVESALSRPPLEGYFSIPAGVQLRSLQASIQGEQIVLTLDFSRELLSNGTGAALEDALHQLLTPIGNLPLFSSASREHQIVRHLDFNILVEGVALQDYLSS